VLGYRLDDDATNHAIPGLKEAFIECLKFLVTTEESFGTCGMWTGKTSVAYARYHAAWCGVVGLMPRPIENEPVSFVGELGELVPRFL